MYGCLFLLVIGVAIAAGFMVASSLPSVKIGNPVAGLFGATATVARVEVRLVTPSPPQAGEATAVAASTQAEGAGFVTATPQPAPTVVVPTPGSGIAPTTPPDAAGGATPTVTRTATASRTPTRVRTPTATRPAQLFVTVGTPVARPEKQCYVGAVFGYVYDEKGQPIEGVQVRVSDPWNNVVTAVTKPAPDAGYYDAIQGSGAATWYVAVVDGLGNELSPVVTVQHPEGDSACWYQVDFKRTRAR